MLFVSVTIGSEQKNNGFSAATLRRAQELHLPYKTGEKGLRIAFGSCYGIYEKRSDIFDTIATDEPDLFIWLGDVAYVDNLDNYLDFGGPMPPGYIRERLEMTKSAAGYAKV